MNIYRVSQSINRSYDTFDSFICYAESEEQARKMSPSGRYKWSDTGWVGEDGTMLNERWGTEWVNSNQIDEVMVEYIGENPLVTEPSVILGSFNAG